MSNTPKIPAQELADNLSQLVNRTRTGVLMFDGFPFERRFHTLEVERGVKRFLEQLPRSVMAYTTEQAVCDALIEYTAKLPRQDELTHYKLTASKLAQVVAYWRGMNDSMFTQKIYPVLELSQPGYCHHRLEFDAREGPTPLFDSFMSHVITNNEALMAFIGGLLDPDFRRQFYLWVWGVGGDGKGVLMRFLRRLFQNAYAALSSSAKAQESQFFTNSLVGKRVAAFQDCHNPKLVSSELFMQLSGGDPLRIEPKGKDAYTAEVDAIPVISSNDKPAFTGSPAHMRRAVICEMQPRTVYDGDKNTFEERLWLEAPAILWKCKEAWRKMKAEHGGMVACVETTRSIADEAESRFSYITDKYFDLRDGASGLAPHTLHGFLIEKERLTEFEFGAYKKYLLRAGVKVVQRTTGKREWVGIAFKEAHKAIAPHF